MKIITYAFSYCFLCLTLLGDDLKLDDFKKSKSVWLSSEKVTVENQGLKTYILSTETEVQIHVKNGTVVKKGQHIATLNPEQLDVERDLYQLEVEQLEVKIEELQISIDEKYEALQDTHKELNEKKRKLKFVRDEPKLSSSNKKRIDEAIKLLDEKIGKLDEKLIPERKERDYDLEKRELDLNFSKRKKSMEVLEHNSMLKASFNGQLDYVDEDLKLGEAVWVEPNEEMFTVTDNTKINFVCIPAAQSVFEVSPDNIHLVFNTGDGAVRGSFDHKKKVKLNNGDTLQFVFNVDNDKEKLTELVGVTRVAHLFYHFKKEYHMVPRKELDGLHPDILEKDGWRGVVKKVWPDAKLKLVAPSILVVERISSE